MHFISQFFPIYDSSSPTKAAGYTALKKKKVLEFDLLRNVRLHHDILLPLNLPTPVNDTTTKCYFDNGSA